MRVFTRWWGIVLAAAAALAAGVVLASNIRFQRSVASEGNRMLAAAADPCRIDSVDLEVLPAPVRRYLARAIGPGHYAARAVRLWQHGTFRTDLQGKWYPIAGEQYVRADPPAFLWWGRVRIAPGLWIDARDRSVAGAGNMLVMAESTFTLADVSGPALDQGALLRLLGELVWRPTAFLDDRYIQWSAIDGRHAAATFTVSGRSVTGSFEFDGEGLPVRFSANRFRDLGGGKSVLTPFLGEYRNYCIENGMLVPTDLVGSWVIDGAPRPYARFTVTRMAFDAVFTQRKGCL